MPINPPVLRTPIAEDKPRHPVTKVTTVLGAVNISPYFTKDLLPRRGNVTIVQSRLHESDVPGFIDMLDGAYEFLNLPMTYEPKLPAPLVVTGPHMPREPLKDILGMPAWGLTKPPMIVIPPDRPDVRKAMENLVTWSDMPDLTCWDVKHEPGTLVIGIDTAGPGGTGTSTVFERQPDGSLLVIDFFTSTWNRRRQKRLDRGIKLKAPPSRGWARHIRKQKAKRP